VRTHADDAVNTVAAAGFDALAFTWLRGRLCKGSPQIDGSVKLWRASDARA
jgi:hypothetical protein